MSDDVIPSSDAKDVGPAPRPKRRIWLKISLTIASLAAVIVLAVLLDVQFKFVGRIADPSSVTKEPVAIVLGASVLSTKVGSVEKGFPADVAGISLQQNRIRVRRQPPCDFWEVPSRQSGLAG